MITTEIIEKIRVDIIESGMDQRYTISAYDFILRGIDFCRAQNGREVRHYSGQELSFSFLRFAERQFGPLAMDVLSHWGITTTADFGYIVYNLIEIKILSKHEEDRLEDFFSVVDFENFFNKCYFYEIDKSFIKTIKGA